MFDIECNLGENKFSFLSVCLFFILYNSKAYNCVVDLNSTLCILTQSNLITLRQQFLTLVYFGISIFLQVFENNPADH